MDLMLDLSVQIKLNMQCGNHRPPDWLDIIQQCKISNNVRSKMCSMDQIMKIRTVLNRLLYLNLHLR